MRYKFYNIKSKRPQKQINETLDELEKRFAFCYSDCKYDLTFKNRHGFDMYTTFYHRSRNENHEFLREIEEYGYKFRMIRKLTFMFL